MAHVFISYAHTDHEYARKLADDLLANGFDVWIDDRIDFGSRWMREIFTAIDNCSAFIVIMTPRAYEREWVENERLYAKKRNKIVFPLLLEGEAFPDLGATQYYDVSGGKLPEPAFLERLATFTPRASATGRDVATVPQQQAKLQFETSEIEKAEPEVAAAPPQQQVTLPSEASEIEEAEPEVVADPPQPAANRTQPTRRGSFVLAVIGMIAALAIVILAANALNNRSASTTTETPTHSITQTPGQGIDQPVNTPGANALASTPSSGGHGEIAFVTDQDGNNEIYLVNADGTNPRNLTNNPARDTEPAWSPDGSHIVFTSYRVDDNPRTFIMDADGSNVHRLLDDFAGWDPAWSPDGTQIAFGAYGTGSADIFVVGADGSNLRPLTHNTYDEGYPAWSPDGSHIVFVAKPAGHDDIYIMDADGGNIRGLTDDTASDTNPVWSPDGTRIAFQSDRDGYARVYVIGIDGNNLNPLFSAPGDSYEPAWSPDGTQIVFPSYRESNDAELYIADADGTHIRRLTNNSSEDRYPAWGL